MKKIFAIALALVMVLSMTSAFASVCDFSGKSWDLEEAGTNCGKATVKVVPYIRVNDSCDLSSSKFVESTCAAAVVDENVYYAVVLTVPADIDMEWWNPAVLTMTTKGVVGAKKDVKVTKPVLANYPDTEEDGWVFYYDVANKAWTEYTEDEDAFKLAAVMNVVKVTKASEAKVCAKLASKVDTAKNHIVGDFKVTYTAPAKAAAGKPAVAAKLVIQDKDNAANVVTYEGDAGDLDGLVKKMSYDADSCSATFLDSVEYFFGIEVSKSYISADNIKANLGWDEKVESCYEWKTNASSIVDAECVVAIPKTGDASVLAWLF